LADPAVGDLRLIAKVEDLEAWQLLAQDEKVLVIHVRCVIGYRRRKPQSC
jgi:hypothetical protein